MPDSLRPALRGYDPFAIIDCLVVHEQFGSVVLERFSDAVCALPPVPHGRNVLERVTGESGPTAAHLQNAIVFIMDDEWNWGFDNRPIEEADDFIPGRT